jgi:sugar lactone lactonase YvrE
VVRRQERGARHAPDGAVIGEIAVPERVGNLCFGGKDGTSLLMCGSSSLYRIRLTGLWAMMHPLGRGASCPRQSPNKGASS